MSNASPDPHHPPLNRQLAARWLAAGRTLEATAKALDSTTDELAALLRLNPGFQILVEEYRREAALPPAKRLELVRARCLAGVRQTLASGRRLSSRDRHLLQQLSEGNTPPDPLRELLDSLTPEALAQRRTEDGDVGTESPP